jgi:hypothetical protein
VLFLCLYVIVCVSSCLGFFVCLYDCECVFGLCICVYFFVSLLCFSVLVWFVFVVCVCVLVCVFVCLPVARHSGVFCFLYF